MTKTLCRTCRHLRTCRIIGTPPETEMEKVSSDEDPKSCARWSALSEGDWTARAAAYEISGLDSLRGIRFLDVPDITGEEDIVSEPEKPDLRKLAGSMIAYKAREEQLRYRTEPNGEFSLDTHGQKIPRDTFWLRDYAVDPQGPVCADKSVVWFWSKKQLVDEILRAEKEAGIVVSADEVRKAQKNPMAVNPATKKESDMPRVINLNRGGRLSGAPAQSEEAPKGTKIARAATAKPPLSGDGEAQEETAVPSKARIGFRAPAQAAPAPAAEVDLNPVMDRIGRLEIAVAELAEKIGGIGAAIAEANTKQTDEVQELITSAASSQLDELLKGITYLHDVMMQTVTGEDKDSLASRGLTIMAYGDQVAEEAESGNA